MGLRIVFVVAVFLAVWFGVGLMFHDSLPVVEGLGPSYTAMFLGAVVAAPLFFLLVILPTTRNHPD